MDLYASVLASGDRVSLPLRDGRHAWVQVIRGSVTVNGKILTAGDGAAISEESALDITGVDAAAEVLVFDLA